MSKEKFGIGIIGCGMIANFHAKAIAAMEGATVVACFERNPERGQQFAEEYDCKAYADLDAMLADSAVDVVTICTPSGAHMDPAIAAAKAGKH
ncbi:MAG: Gfo/Idh/MocA family oxidoreductase, partial [Lentisphaeria bacterium]|nr:Gfo/Idh/MocA family oxidoreductase [Lentisphaeria bacterium]